jgi:hypothetical protein
VPATPVEKLATEAEGMVGACELVRVKVWVLLPAEEVAVMLIR